MMFYLSVILVLFTIRYVAANHGGSHQVVYGLVLLFLFVFSAFRFEVGCDWSGYLNQFNVMKYSLLYPGAGLRDPLWESIIELLHRVGLSYPWLNVVSSLIFFIGVHFFSRRQPDPLGFLVLLFPVLIINMPMSGIRQGAAIGFMCLAFIEFSDKRTFRFIFWTLIAAGIHSSAIVWLLLIPLMQGRLNAARYAYAGIAAIPGLFLILTGAAADQAMQRYMGTGVESAGAVFRIMLLSLTGLFFLIFLRPFWRRNFPRDYRLVVIAAWSMVFLLALLPISSVVSDRFTYYLMPIQVMILARIPFLGFRNQRTFWVALPYAGLVVFFIVWTQAGDHFSQCYIPYDNWFFGYPEGSYHDY